MSLIESRPNQSRNVPVRDLTAAREPRAKQKTFIETDSTQAPDNHKNKIPKDKRLKLQEESNRDLNDGQRKLVQHGRGALLAIAGPGSGKTYSAVKRIGNLVSHQVVPARILAVTFSREAANNLKDRAREMLSPYTKGLPDSRTLNSLGFKIVKEYAEALNYKNGVRVVPTNYQEQFLERALDSLDPDAHRSIKGKKIPELAAVISEWKSQGLSPLAVMESKHPLAKAYMVYQKWLQQTGFIDFDDQIRLAVVVLSMDNSVGEAARSKWQHKYDYIMVDEAQDTNKIQEDLVTILAERHGNICFIGDDDQAIYEWRGADVRNIRTVHRRWPGCEIAKLTVNYRSTPEIVEAANNLMRHSTEERHVKKLESAKPSGVEPQILVSSDQQEEAQRIANYIKARIEEESKKPKLARIEGEKVKKFGPGDFAIIVRDRFNSNIENIKQALAKEKIPYKIWFKEERPMGPIKRNAYSLIQALSDPIREEPAFLQLFRSPEFNLHGDDYERLMSMRGNGERSIWEIMRSKDINSFSRDGRKKIAQLGKLVNNLRTRVNVKGRTESLSEIVFDGFKKLYPELTKPEVWNRERKNDESSKPDPVTYLKKIISNIDSHMRRAKERNKTLESYLHFQLVEIPRRIREGQAKKKVSEDRKDVSILTMHGSKGLEFPEVITPSAIEGTMPSKRVLEEDLERIARNRSQPKLPGMEDDEKSSGIEQERRLFFVTVTRPKERLTISYPRTVSKRGHIITTTPCRFIQDMGHNESPSE